VEEAEEQLVIFEGAADIDTNTWRDLLARTDKGWKFWLMMDVSENTATEMVEMGADL